MALRLVIHGLVDPRSSSAVGTWYCVRIRTRNSCSHLAMLHHAPRTIAFGTVADVVGALRSRVDAMEGGMYETGLKTGPVSLTKKPKFRYSRAQPIWYAAISAPPPRYLPHTRWQIGSNFQVARPPPQTPLRFKQNSYSCKKSELRLLGDLNFDFTNASRILGPQSSFHHGFCPSVYVYRHAIAG